MIALSYFIPRSEMPQVAESAYPALLDWLPSQGVAFRHCLVPPSRLRAHQEPDRFNPATFNPALLAKPCLVAEDWFILDGHHRWMAHKANGSDVPCLWLTEPFAKALPLLFTFPATYETKGSA